MNLDVFKLFKLTPTQSRALVLQTLVHSACACSHRHATLGHLNWTPPSLLLLATRVLFLLQANMSALKADIHLGFLDRHLSAFKALYTECFCALYIHFLHFDWCYLTLFCYYLMSIPQWPALFDMSASFLLLAPQRYGTNGALSPFFWIIILGCEIPFSRALLQ